jgi:hypothetical protein
MQEVGVVVVLLMSIAPRANSSNMRGHLGYAQRWSECPPVLRAVW